MEARADIIAVLAVTAGAVLIMWAIYQSPGTLIAMVLG